MMIVTGIFSQNIFGERHNLKIKRQIIPSIHNEGVADYNSLQYLNENQIFQERYLNHDEEMVGIFPLGLLRGAARHITRRVRPRSRLHHPHLLQPTPNHLLEDNEKEADRRDVNEVNPILQSPQLHHEETPQTENRHYKPITAERIICNFDDPEETIYEQPESRNRHSSEHENVSQGPHIPANHFHHKVNAGTTTPCYPLQYNDHQRHHEEAPQANIVNQMQDHYDPLTAGRIICNFNDHEETVYEQPESKSRHSSEHENVSQGPHIPANHFQARHFHHKGDIYSLINQHLQKHSKFFGHDKVNAGPSTPYPQSNDHQAYGQNNNNLPQSSTTNPISSINGEKITINQNFQISQIEGNNNAVNQAQTSNKHSSNIPNDSVNMHDNQNHQESQINGSYNAISQTQASHNNHLNSIQDNTDQFFANQNNQISEIYGNNNAVTQSQESNHHHSSGPPPNNYFSPHDQPHHQYSNIPNDNYLQIDGNENFQGSNINGNNNAVTQGQTSNRNNHFSPHDQPHHQYSNMPNDYLQIDGNENFQSSDINGNNNAVTQGQTSNRNNHFSPHHQPHHQYSNMPNDYLQIDGNQNFQVSNINGNNNAVTQGQTSNRNFIDHTVVGTPYLLNFEKVKSYYPPERSSEQLHSVKRSKRQIKLLELITNPNSQLDVSQTIENVGNAARNAMENEQRPSFHIKNAVGSAKNAVMSSMRIVPQNLIIPSDYKIIEKTALQSSQKKANDRLQAINQNLLENLSNSKMRTSPKFLHEKFDDAANEEQFVKTYAKVGSMVRDSVRSSKETLHHIGNAYSNARKAVAVARHSAPKILMRSMRIPEVRRNFQFKPLERVGSRQNDFVGASEMMNSFGILTPKSQRGNFKRNAVIGNPPAANHDFDRNIKSPPKSQHYNKYAAEHLQILDDVRNVMGSKTLNELLGELEKKYNSAYDNKMRERNSQKLSAEIQQQSLDTRNTFDMLKSFSDGDILGSNLQENKFSSASKTPEENTRNVDFEYKAILKIEPRIENSLEIRGYDGHEYPYPKDGRSKILMEQNEYNPKSRISMTMGDKLVTPYMGKLEYDNTEPYYDNYENDSDFYK